MSTSSGLSDRVLQLEELVSHQQHLVQQLNDVVVQLRMEVAKLDTKLGGHEARLKWIAENQSAVEDRANEKPPHY